MNPMRARAGMALAILTLLGPGVTAQQAPQVQQPSPFRSRVTLVPVDVRVVDSKGKPITGLTQSDFTISEDGVPQPIVHFSFHTLTATAPAAGAPPDFRKPLGESIAPPSKRVFLIVLGRGRQVGPVKGVEAAMRFVKERLLSQDQVAILAYNRATDFTTDHAKAFATLERYWKKHESIEAKLAHHFSGLQAMYGSREIPAKIQNEIDAVFQAPGALTSRSLTSTEVPEAAAKKDATRQNTDLIQRAEIAAERIRNGVGTPFDESAVNEAALLDMSFEEFAEKSFNANDDLEKIYAGVRYMRYLDGEKHMVVLTPQGLFLPAIESANSLAALSNDARVAIDFVHTYGMTGAMPMRARTRPTIDNAVPSANAIFNQRFTNANSQQISRLTGGTTTVFQEGAGAFERLDAATRSQYLLGYAPSNGNWNGAYRRIDVKVNRKDARVLYRHGYMARRDVTPLNREQYLTYARIANAANHPKPIGDLKLTTGTPVVEGSGETRRVSVDIRILPATIKLTRVADAYVGKVEALAFCGDRKQNILGEAWQTLDFKLTEENYQKFLREGAGLTVRIPISGEPAYVKIILYDYAADLVGSAMIETKKK